MTTVRATHAMLGDLPSAALCAPGTGRKCCESDACCAADCWIRKRYVLSLGNRSPRSCKRPAALQLFAPRLYKFYSSTLDSVCANDPNLKRNFEKSVFAAMTINLGPQTVTRKHVDHFNIPFGWCVITALGDFDYTRGGHLVLWELKLIIEFPAGSTIFIPSATINHSNIAVQPHE